MAAVLFALALNGCGKDSETISVSSISIEPSALVLYLGDAPMTLSAEALPSDATNSSLVWTSSDESVVSVSDGIVTANSLGSAEVVASAADGSGVSSSCRVTVKRPVPEGAVDLGVSVYWAKCNIGASTPSGYGDYFAWGETGPKDDYNSDDYGNTQEDAASVLLGEAWRVPTMEEFEELINPDNCDWTWTQEDGIDGYLIKSRKPEYGNNSIFLPAAGGYYSAKTFDVGTEGNYWSSTISKSDTGNAGFLHFRQTYKEGIHGVRYFGRSVRAVTQ